MSARKIRSLLKKKGIEVESIIFQRSYPVPEGYASGYDLEFSDETVDELFDRGFHNIDSFMEFGVLSEVERWIESIPSKDSD